MPDAAEAARLLGAENADRSAEGPPALSAAAQDCEHFRGMRDMHPADLLGVAGDGMVADRPEDPVGSGADEGQEAPAPLLPKPRQDGRRIGLGEIGHHETGIEAAGAAADSVGFEEAYLCAAPRQMPCGRQPGEPAADHGHVEPPCGFERHRLRLLVRGLPPHRPLVFRDPVGVHVRA